MLAQQVCAAPFDVGVRGSFGQRCGSSSAGSVRRFALAFAARSRIWIHVVVAAGVGIGEFPGATFLHLPPRAKRSFSIYAVLDLILLPPDWGIAAGFAVAAVDQGKTDTGALG